MAICGAPNGAGGGGELQGWQSVLVEAPPFPPESVLRAALRGGLLAGRVSCWCFCSLVACCPKRLMDW